MRILRMCVTLPPFPGGMENHVAQITAQQRSLRHEVSVLFCVGEATSPADIQVMAGREIAYWRPQAMRDIVFGAAALRKLRGMRARFDAVHMHGDWCSFLAARVIARAVGARILIASIHDQAGRRPWLDHIYRFALAPFDLIYSTGMDDAERLSAITGRRVEWMTSGVAEDWFDADGRSTTRPGTEGFDVLSVGTLNARKNVALAIEIARRLPHYSFGIVGDGPERARLERAAASLPNITFMGRLGRTELRRVYLGSRLFLGTATSEGTPTVMLEAMALGLVVVTSRSNDYSRVLPDNRHGRVVEGNDPDKFAEAVASYLADPTALAEASRVNPAMAESFTWPAIARRMERLLGAVQARRMPAAQANGDPT
jgi:glycosyltransferase involved in cell wall biosynthesis